ncbi:flagellar brake protein [Oceanicoccus sp. KOV_DT_Chl]|uniref:flagellar brake protein n=1 Tax=Oceanicoccus sp. KOV_DT_Chl TaxID=1904639 RepID=UPI000C7DCBB8|nr:flagellar brake protein [Oceanicoccus sp. KOV_DT_Chl]
MSFLKSLIHRVFSDNDADKSETDDRYAQLEQLRIDHDWINVNITKTDQTYQSLIVTIDIENGELIIDDLYPPENLDQLEAGDTIEIFSQSRTKLVNFYTRILAREFHDGSPSWRLELPTEIGRNHSRGAYRIYVESEQGLELDIYHDNEPIPDVHIINLSAEGLKLSISQQAEGILKTNQHFTNCIIRLPSGFDVDCDLDLRNSYHIRTPTPHILAGGKLTIHNPQQRVKLQQYLAAVQRHQRRREMRVN